MLPNCVDTPCVVWTGACNDKGYGQRRHNGKTHYVHRLAWEETNGPIPPGLFVLHRCDNRPCHNPDHLFLGTAADNTRDMINKGRDRHVGGEAHWSARLTRVQVDEIRERYAAGGILQRELAQEYGMSRSQIGHILSGRKWVG